MFAVHLDSGWILHLFLCSDGIWLNKYPLCCHIYNFDTNDDTSLKNNVYKEL